MTAADVTLPASRPLIWDLPTRAFHWLLAASFAGAYAVSDSDRWIVLHAVLGYTVGGLVAFRLVWGVLGTRHARFSGFAWSPGAAVHYLRSLLAGRPQHYAGHNPAGSWAVVGLLALVSLTAASGWAAFNEVGPHWVEDVHEACANATLALVVVHVLAVIVSSLLHRENLIAAMLNGRKRASAGQAADGPRRLLAAALVAVVVMFWGGWIGAPGLERGTGWAALSSPAPRGKALAAGEHRGQSRHRGKHTDDDDD